MNILVTGGGAFLESLSSIYLLIKNIKLQVFLDLFIKSLKKRVTCIQGDIKNTQDVLKACEGQDAVIHVASKVGMYAELASGVTFTIQM